ncbi:DivIVA domain-containing protein [Lactobacillus ultunensis]|uniref:DivIVA domain protein n=1 Tax=Lactobacillus ultunensis DSM 16047 TaxID=525365 RepID=C2EK38_9LACO|nr:DivIVA domain-containing protein [Lactobacillus ultunensis]EEJ73053.1 DivIVA domain protein [Lactobacillus ultunensis DSM 16047]KRL82678.1 cell division initiation protein [Lactobacillus ultunensis DSM 16047]QQP29428.1 DivIVA domain-containing protein [Lactobacillus ultunensis]
MANLNDIKLSAQDILKKQFRSKVKGYDPDEVDAYLDQVISDYETFQQLIEDLYGQIGTLQRQLMDEKQKEKKTVEAEKEEEEKVKTYTPTHRRSSMATNFAEDDDNQGEISTNMAIIQRISTLERKVYNLEQHVYGLKH